MKHANKTAWTKLTFGKYKGMTLPQIITIDLDWFCWMTPKLYGRLGAEAQCLAERATAIKLPKSKRKGFETEYQYERDGRLCDFSIVEKTAPIGRRSIRLPYLDLSAAHRAKKYDKSGCRRLIDGFRFHYFGRRKRLTRKRCEKFFSNAKNFARRP